MCAFLHLAPGPCQQETQMLPEMISMARGCDPQTLKMMPLTYLPSASFSPLRDLILSQAEKLHYLTKCTLVLLHVFNNNFLVLKLSIDEESGPSKPVRIGGRVTQQRLSEDQLEC